MRVKIIGYGVSGKAAESYLASRGFETLVVKNAAEPTSGEFDFCVVSPGVPASLVAAETIPVVPEVELPFYLEPKLKPQTLVAVTGTNGKTTIVNQITQLCLQAGKKTVLCGNVGTPVSRVADQLAGAVVVVEVSSFMLEQTKILHPQIAVLTNITSDHLDRHQTLEEYKRCKAQITAQQRRGDLFIVNWDDPQARAVGLAVAQQLHHPKVLWYSIKEPVPVGIYVQQGIVYEKSGRGKKRLGSATDLGGMPHTLSNTLAVIAVGRRLKIKLPLIWQACRYREQAHRIELVADVKGLVFYNDSKATNIAATLAATRAFALPICLILSGLSKGQDYQELFKNLPANVQQIVVFGACQAEILTTAQSNAFSAIYPVADLTAAVKQAQAFAARPGVVLFSPAGSSFDQFENYEDRGEKFREAVHNLILPAE